MIAPPLFSTVLMVWLIAGLVATLLSMLAARWSR
jgi:hypothetical protein